MAGTFGAPVVVVVAGGIPVINDPRGVPMTVGDIGIGVAVTIVTKNGTPAALLKEDGTAYS